MLPPPPPSSLLLLFSPMTVSHFHAFQREEEGKRQINNISFQRLCSQKRTKWGGGGRRGDVGGLRPATENCCPYPERSVYTSHKVKQIDPGCSFTCVFVWLPVNLLACHLQSLLCVPDQTALSHSLSLSLSHTSSHPFLSLPSVFVYFCLCAYFPRGCQAWIQRST